MDNYYNHNYNSKWFSLQGCFIYTVFSLNNELEVGFCSHWPAADSIWGLFFFSFFRCHGAVFDLHESFMPRAEHTPSPSKSNVLMNFYKNLSWLIHTSSFQDSHISCLTSTSLILPSCWFTERTGTRDSAGPSMDSHGTPTADASLTGSSLTYTEGKSRRNWTNLPHNL